MEVTIVSMCSNRPDFIKPQFELMKKYLEDPFRFIVVNNAYYGQDTPEEIEAIAKEEGLGYMRIRHKGHKPEPSALVRDTLEHLWKYLKKTEGILAIVDSDLFFTHPVSFNLILEGYDMAFCPNFTEGKVWPWTGLMIFDMSKIHAEDISFEFAPLDGRVYADVGSAVAHYVDKHHPKIRALDRASVYDQDVEFKGKKLSELGFPHPYSIDMVSLCDQPFMFHYKTSSNYANHCTPEYNVQKTEALKALLAL